MRSLVVSDQRGLTPLLGNTGVTTLCLVVSVEATPNRIAHQVAVEHGCEPGFSPLPFSHGDRKREERKTHRRHPNAPQSLDRTADQNEWFWFAWGPPTALLAHKRKGNPSAHTSVTQSGKWC